MGFTNNVTVAVWIGYDNADGKRRTLGGGSTGGGVAVPIFEPVMQAAWTHVAPKSALTPPSPETKRQLICKSTDSDAIAECFRVDAKGKVIDTQNRLISRASALASEDREDRSSRKKEGRPSRHHRERAVSRVSSWPSWGWGWGWAPRRYYPAYSWGRW